MNHKLLHRISVFFLALMVGGCISNPSKLPSNTKDFDIYKSGGHANGMGSFAGYSVGLVTSSGSKKTRTKTDFRPAFFGDLLKSFPAKKSLSNTTTSTSTSIKFKQYFDDKELANISSQSSFSKSKSHSNQANNLVSLIGAIAESSPRKTKNEVDLFHGVITFVDDGSRWGFELSDSYWGDVEINLFQSDNPNNLSNKYLGSVWSQSGEYIEVSAELYQGNINGLNFMIGDKMVATMSLGLASSQILFKKTLKKKHRDVIACIIMAMGNRKL